ncbi:MAG TPA: hypothetical protein DCQ34_01915 [Chitinophagaceae bacterium]|nr:hypothetical protein [Chitinophagaceae bacterium]HCY89576.1 hypothetical protein [Chitinophagaceae bacterium]
MMRNIFRVCLAVIMATALHACGDTTNNTLIVGKWQAVSWTAGDQPSGNNATGTSFQFDSTGHYIFDYGATRQKGTYKVENNMLFTKAEGQQEIMVLIEKLTNDSLVFNMNRGGQAEKLSLVRAQ